MTGVTRYEELLVYQLSDQVRLRVRPIVERAAFNRHWKLRDQITEAAESACPCIAEGFARFNPRENANLVRVARGSLTELIVHMGRAMAARLVVLDEHDEVVSLARRAVQASTKYINYLDNAEIPGTPPPRHRRPRPAGNGEEHKKPRMRRDIDNDDRNL